MGSAREGHDLLHPYGRWHVWKYVKRRRSLRGIYWRDTFGRFDCWLRGHKPKDFREPHEKAASWSCTRCNHYLPKYQKN